mmetsp:Transcript_5207/g.6714  ORF Transcript_5207/g.6714 Transcript_5207/m.6714 type:complete len:311 (+) Transcript_5207:84-1016(+)
MPSELTTSVQAAIENFIQLKTSDDHGHIAIDVLRAIRDESTLLMERQIICDTFDSDPLKLFDDDPSDENIRRKKVDGLKKQMKVISCSRSITKDYTSIEAVVEFTKDSRMKDVDDCLRLVFSFERLQKAKNHIDVEHHVQNVDDVDKEQQTQNRCRLNQEKSLTNITYNIDVSKDHAIKERLLTIQVNALGNAPSVEPAVPMVEEMVQEFDEHGNLIDTNDKNKSFPKSDSEEESNENADKYAAYVDPEILEKFLKWAALDLDAQNSLFLLMTFPFYEHEWDLFGFLLDCVFGYDDESMETCDEEEEDET